MKGWVPPPDWEHFLATFVKVERSSYYDTRELALRLLERLDGEKGKWARENNEAITLVLEHALKKVP